MMTVPVTGSVRVMRNVEVLAGKVYVKSLCQDRQQAEKEANQKAQQIHLLCVHSRYSSPCGESLNYKLLYYCYKRRANPKRVQ